MTRAAVIGQPQRAERSLFTPEALAVLDSQTTNLADLFAVPESVQLDALAATAATAHPMLPSALPASPSTKFADCSSNNPRPNLEKYKHSGRDRIGIKATEGSGYTYFAGNDDHSTAHALGLKVSRYHWLRPDSGSAVDQAQQYWAATHDLWRRGDSGFVDWETSYNYNTGLPVPDPDQAVWAQFLRDFAAEVRRLLRTLPFPVPFGLYTGNWYLDNKPAMQSAARAFWVILSDYSGVFPVNNRYRLTIAAHQYTSSQDVAGFSKPLDDNYLIDWPAAGSATGGGASETEDEAPIIKILPLLRAILIGGRYATPHMRKTYPRIVHGIGVARRTNKVEGDIEALTRRVRQLEHDAHAGGPHAAHADQPVHSGHS
jgi:GH25 family lysozyme M1 (1,4-beta-N-acetylmuramidase)